MIKYDNENNLVTMDLTDLEHCGFDHELFNAELETVGITKLAAQWPVILVVNFRGGHAISNETDTQTLERVVFDRKTFDIVVGKITGGTK